MPIRSLQRLLPLVWVASLGLALTACAQPAPASSPAPPARSAPSASPAQQPSAIPSAATGGASTTVSLFADGSEARYEARERLVGQSLPSTAVGSTREVTGTVVLDAQGRLVPEQSKVVVDLRSLRSDETRRDNYIQGNTLETQQFPTAEFVPLEAQGAPAGLPSSGEAAFQLRGDLTVHSLTRPVVWDVTARFDGSVVTGRATTQVKLTDFGMTPPRVGPVLSMDDVVTLALEFRGTTNMSPAGAESLAPAEATQGRALDGS